MQGPPCSNSVNWFKSPRDTISLDDFKNLWQIFEKLFFSMNDYDFVLGLLDDINAFDGWEIHILKINYH